jgi:hypothetical protein
MISVNDKFILVTDLHILRIRRDVGAITVLTYVSNYAVLITIKFSLAFRTTLVVRIELW